MKKPLILLGLVFICSCSSQHVPKGVDVIEEKVGACDHFGDYSYCVRIKVNDKQLEQLKEKGFSWFPSHIRKKLENPAWKSGELPDNILGWVRGLDVHLSNPPVKGKRYEYIHQWVDGGFWRIVVIDKAVNEAFYYSVTW